MTIWTLFGLMKGIATTGWPGDPAASGQDGVAGLPRYTVERCAPGCTACAEACPTDAIVCPAGDISSFRLDYGRCIVCQRCVEACPTGALEASFDWAFGVGNRSDLVLVGGGGEEERKPDRDEVKTAFRHSLHIRHVDAGSCNGCESELQALNNPFYNLHRFGIFFTPSPRSADVLLVTGPVTHAMHDALRATYAAMPTPKWVIAVGTCAVSGGIAHGGYASGNGLEGVLPVDIYLPGCPPNPAAIVEALLILQGRASQKVRSGRYGE